MKQNKDKSIPIHIVEKLDIISDTKNILRALQGRNRGTDIENWHITQQEKESGMIRRLGLTYIHYHV